MSGGAVTWLALALTQGPGTAVTPVDAGTSSIVGYVLGYGPLGLIALALAYLMFRGWRLVPPSWEPGIRTTARAEARADLERENARIITERDDALKVAQQMIPLLTQFTATTAALIPLLQELVRNQERRNGGR